MAAAGESSQGVRRYPGGEEKIVFKVLDNFIKFLLNYLILFAISS